MTYELPVTIATLPASVQLSEQPLWVVRDYAEALVRRYVPSDLGTTHFEEMTQGRATAAYKQKIFFSTCGFLVHWLLWRLGARDQTYINWDDPDTLVDEYRVGMNLNEIWAGGQKAGVFQPYSADQVYEKGDVTYIADANFSNNSQHVFVFLAQIMDWDGNLLWISADAGQVNSKGQQCARICTRVFKDGVLYGNSGSVRKVVGRIPLDRVKLTAEASLNGP